jgi:hypothetical protein
VPKLLLIAALLCPASSALAFSVDTDSVDQPIRINPVYTVELADGSTEDVVRLPSSVSFHLSLVRDHIAHADLTDDPTAHLDSGYDPVFEGTPEAILSSPESVVQDRDPQLLILSGSGVDPNVLAEHLR